MIIPYELRLLIVNHSVYCIDEDQNNLEYDVCITICHFFYVNFLLYNNYKNWFDFKWTVRKYKSWFRALSDKITGRDEDPLKPEDIRIPIYFFGVFTIVFGLTDWDRYL